MLKKKFGFRRREQHELQLQPAEPSGAQPLRKPSPTEPASVFTRAMIALKLAVIDSVNYLA